MSIPLSGARPGPLCRQPVKRVEGWLLAGSATLLPWLGALALAAVPWALADAAERDRRQRVSHFRELMHSAVGDPLSWSRR